MKYSHFEVDKALDEMRIIADTREQDTAAFRKRFAACVPPPEISRRKLDFGDYTAETSVGDEVISLAEIAVIERKMSLDELALCFGRERGRFEREFLRAKAAGAKIYLLVENANWENLLAGKYRSKLPPKSFAASLAAWTARYDLVPVFCKAESSGRVMALILRYELRNFLERGEDDG